MESTEPDAKPDSLGLIPGDLSIHRLPVHSCILPQGTHLPSHSPGGQGERLIVILRVTEGRIEIAGKVLC